MVFSVKHADAQFRSTNNESTIEIESIDIAPTNTPIPSPNPHIPTPTVNPRSQLPNIPVISETTKQPRFFSLELSHSDIDFGSIDPTEPVIRTNDIIIDRGNASGMSLFVYQNHPLTVSGKPQLFIPDTTCDDGACTSDEASLWVNTLTYGAGYRCENETVCNLDFNTQHSYRPFATVNKNKASASILSDSVRSQKAVLKMNYKINISGTQQKGSYTNALIFIAAPTF